MLFWYTKKLALFFLDSITRPTHSEIMRFIIRYCLLSNVQTLLINLTIRFINNVCTLQNKSSSKIKNYKSTSIINLSGFEVLKAYLCSVLKIKILSVCANIRGVSDPQSLTDIKDTLNLNYKSLIRLVIFRGSLYYLLHVCLFSIFQPFHFV